MGHELPDGRRLHRPVGLRAVADRPQVGAHPRRGPGLRRRAAERRAEARGLGLAELGRHRHRRRAPAASSRSTTASAASSTALSSYLMKSPQNQRPDDEAREDTEKFIAKYGGKGGPKSSPKGRTAREEGRGEEARRQAHGRQGLTPRRTRFDRRPATRRAVVVRARSPILAPCPTASPSPRSRRTLGAPARGQHPRARASAPSSPRAGTASLIVAPSSSPQLVRDGRRADRAPAARRCWTRADGDAARARGRRGAATPLPGRAAPAALPIDVTRTLERPASSTRRSTSSTSTSRSRRASPAPRCATRAR